MTKVESINYNFLDIIKSRVISIITLGKEEIRK